MANDNLKTILQRLYANGLPILQYEIDEIKAAIKKDEEEEKAENTPYDMCPTGNPAHCHLPDGSCKQCSLTN